MNDFVKLDVALEILATKIALESKNSNGLDSNMKSLLNERERLYQGDKEIIDKIFTEYSPEIKKLTKKKSR